MVRGSMCDIRPCGNGWVRFVRIFDVVRIWANVSVVDPGVSRFTNAQPSVSRGFTKTTQDGAHERGGKTERAIFTPVCGHLK